MINWDTSQPGNVASRSARLFVSETSNWWRIDNDVYGLDDDGNLHEWSAWVATSPTPRPRRTPPTAAPTTPHGFGLLNTYGGNYSDTTTTCRLILED